MNCVDPDGRDWYSYKKYSEKDDDQETCTVVYAWTNASSQAELDASGIKGTYLGEAVVVFKGSMNERLGTKAKDPKGLYIDGEGAVPAVVTVYGPSGDDDIQQYTGFTMTSDYELFGAIAEGIYDVNYVLPGKSSPLPSNYVVNNGGPVDCVNGINPSPEMFNPYSPTQKNGIYIHATNSDGKAGGTMYASTGCLLIQGGKQWTDFNAQIGKRDFKLILNRSK